MQRMKLVWRRHRRLVPALLLLGSLAAMSILSACGTEGQAKTSQAEMVKRGEYLVNINGCNDCHTPKIMVNGMPEPDPKRLLSGHPANMPMPAVPTDPFDPNGWAVRTTLSLTAWYGPWGVSFASNLTPDQVTGSGAWTEAAFIKAMRTGKHLGSGRAILPPMPWPMIGKMTDDDLKAVFAYLHSIPPIENMVPQPIPPAAAQ